MTIDKPVRQCLIWRGRCPEEMRNSASFTKSRNTSLMSMLSLKWHQCYASHKVNCLIRSIQHQIDAFTGTSPAADWKGPPGRPQKTWLQQVEEDTGVRFIYRCLSVHKSGPLIVEIAMTLTLWHDSNSSIIIIIIIIGDRQHCQFSVICRLKNELFARSFS